MEQLIEDNMDLVSAAVRGYQADDDTYQVALIALWEAAEKWDRVHPFRPWARVVIRHRLIDHARQAGEPEAELTEDVPASEPEDAESAAELRGRIRRAWSGRTRERRVLLLLVSGRSKEEIARRLGVSKRTVHRIARRGWDRIEKQKRQGG